MEAMNRLMNQVSEYWYIGSMLAKSAIEKNSTAECTAIGVYPIRVLSIFCSVSSAMAWAQKKHHDVTQAALTGKSVLRKLVVLPPKQVWCRSFLMQ